MNHSQLIDELLQELSYRVGVVDIYNKEQQSIISEILTEWGEFEAKETIFNFLNEERVDPDTPVDYIDKKGNKQQTTYQNAMKSKKDTPQYQAAIKLRQDGGDTAEGGTESETGKSLKSSEYQQVVSKEKETRDKLDAENGDKVSKSDKSDKSTQTVPIERKPKDKTLKPIDSVNEFNTNPKFADDGVSDEDFNKNPNIVPTTQQVEFTEDELDRIFGKPRKFPKKYEKVLLRLLNTKKSKDISITDFTDAAGGGTLSSTAGEILTMIGLSIKDDKEAEEFFNKVEAHVKATKSESIIDTGWVKSAKQVRLATHRRYDRQFGKGNWELETMAWDIESEVEALGLEDYKSNKGFSTDTYGKVKVNGESILDEISLKKSKAANLLNTTTNRVDDIYFRGSATQEELDEMDSLETEYNTISSKKDKVSTNRKKEIIARIKQLHDKYNTNVPEDAKVEVTKKKQTSIHKEGLEKNGENLREVNKKYSSLSQEEKDNLFNELESLMGQKFSPKQRKQFEDVLAQITPPLNYEQLKTLNGSVGLGTDSRKVQKTSVMLHAMAKLLNNPAGETYDKLVENAHTHASAVANAILSDKNAKAGLLKSIQEDFPLKSLMTGEENMTLGDLSADQQTLSKVFGVDDFDKLQENLKVRETPPPPSIVYSVEGDEDIPVAEISTRPDGIGYGGTWKLEMKVHKEFAQRIKVAQSELEK